jgi:phosphoribosylanthranilate isomerase
MLIKFCGLTRAEDVALACGLGVDAVGFVLWPDSPRGIALECAARLIEGLPASVTPVGVFVRPTKEDIARAVELTGIRVAQVHAVQNAIGLVSAKWELWVATSLNGSTVRVPKEATTVLDAHDPVRHGGTGQTIDWDAAAHIARERRVILAGGLTSENVGDAIRRAKPHGVDVSSGIEDRPGVKNPMLMRAFANAVRSAGL